MKTLNLQEIGEDWGCGSLLEEALVNLLGEYFNSFVIACNEVNECHGLLVYNTDKGVECLIVVEHSFHRHATLNYKKGKKIKVIEHEERLR